MKTIVTKIPNRRLFLQGQGAIKIGYPWLTYGAIIALEAIVNKKMKVLEFGSGGSTVFWARNCQSVKSYETDPKWYRAVKQKIKRENIKNVDIILCDKHLSFFLESEPNDYYDIILIDSDPKQAHRFRLARMAISKLKKGGWLVLDNYRWFGLDRIDYPGWQIFTFDDFHWKGLGTRLCRKM